MSVSSIGPIPLPTPLRKFLLSGGDPREELGSRWESFLDDIQMVATYDETDPKERLRKVSVWRYEAEQMRHRRNVVETPSGRTHEGCAMSEVDFREMTVVWSWFADLIEEPSILKQLTPFVDERLAGLINDPVARASYNLEGIADEIAGMVRQLTSELDEARPLVQLVYDAQEGDTQDDIDAWHASRPGYRLLLDALHDLNEVSGIIWNSNTLGGVDW